MKNFKKWGSVLLVAVLAILFLYQQLAPGSAEGNQAGSSSVSFAGSQTQSDTQSISVSTSSGAAGAAQSSQGGGSSVLSRSDGTDLAEDGSYTSRDDVALYLSLYGHLPDNFITKSKARALGWNGGSLEPYAPGKCIGGDRFGNNEGLLPEASGRTWTECDIDTLGADSRGAKRIVFSNDGLIYYTDDHYESFTLLYGKE